MTKFQTTIATAALGLAAGVAGLFFIPEGKAAECVYGDTYTMCFEMTGRSGNLNRWTVQVNNKYTTETMDVTCDGKFVDSWRSYGGASKSEARQLAGVFCSF